MSHWIAFPILLPAFAAAILIAVGERRLALQRWLGMGAALALFLVTVVLLVDAAGGSYRVYAVGNWPAPFGIVLVLDRLSALMLLLTALVGLCSLLYALQGVDLLGRYFHPLFQFQLMGLNGAFLAGDLFNLFVFFEVLLIASYGLLAHGGGSRRLSAGIHYVVLNLTGSALFLIAVSLLYGVTGTLNMADMALRMDAIAPADIGLAQTAGLLLLVVFALKAAVFPLYFWLPEAYPAAIAPVAALFALMTKVGVYSILRVYTLVFADATVPGDSLVAPWLLPAALLTLALGTLGVLASRSLAAMIAYLIVASVGTLLTAVGLLTPFGLTAAVYYMGHSTLVGAALFLLADLIARQRGETADALRRAAPVAQPALLGVMFLIGTAAVVGLPPFSGFLGKLMLLQGATDPPTAYWIWSVVLLTGLLMLVGMARAGGVLFWNVERRQPVPSASPAPAAAVGPAVTLLTAVVAMTVWLAPIRDYAEAAAMQLLHPAGYIESVLGRAATAVPGSTAGGAAAR